METPCYGCVYGMQCGNSPPRRRSPLRPTPRQIWGAANEHQMKTVPCASFIVSKSPSSNLMSNNSDGPVYGTGSMICPSPCSRLVQSALSVILYLFGSAIVAGSSSTLASMSSFAPASSTAPKTKSGLIVAFLYLGLRLRAAGLLRFGGVAK